MKAILLDGSQEDDKTGKRVREALRAELNDQGWEDEHIILREAKIGNCAGDFFCWVRTPGVCNIDDDNRTIAGAIANSDLIIYLTPVSFGGYSSTLKRMVDHQIQNVSPFFTKIEGETHHHKRYKKNPDLLAVGWMDAPNTNSEAIFRHLVQRNAINFHSERSVSGVVTANQTDGEIETSAKKWLKDLQIDQAANQVYLPLNGDSSTTLRLDHGNELVDVQRALLLVGSPKTRKSNSNSLGTYLVEQLKGRSIEAETIYLHTVLRNANKMQQLMDAVDAADLVVLAFPIYVDSLPAPVIEALERISAHRNGGDPSHRQIFAAIANCGFPEAHHCETALAICQSFAQQAGYIWAGSLALGGGQMINGVPLAEAGGMTIRIRQSLDLAAEGLLLQNAIPQEAQDMMAKPVIPPWAYRLTGGLGWIQGARRYGATRLLRRRPYLTKAN